jgi:hypothetical protein
MKLAKEKSIYLLCCVDLGLGVAIKKLIFFGIIPLVYTNVMPRFEEFPSSTSG